LQQICPPRQQMPHYTVAAGVIWRDGKFLIAQRLPDDALGGLWEFPGGKQWEGESLPECLQREIREELDFEIEVGELLVTVRRACEHFRITLHAFQCRYAGGRARAIEAADFKWVTLDQLKDYPFPIMDQKIIAILREL